MGRDWFSKPGGRAPRRPASPPAAEGDYKREVVEHPRVQCPYCGSYAVTRTATSWPVRTYVCDGKGCRKVFQTYDEGPKPMARRR